MRTFASARRFANSGGLVICDRFPLAGVETMDGPMLEHLVEPSDRSNLVDKLVALERHYYQAITTPDVVIVLKLPPELALKRRPEDPPASVRARATEIWERVWDDRRVHVVDASRSASEVMTEIRSILWSAL